MTRSSLSRVVTLFYVSFQLNPDMDQCHQLKGWYESEGASASLTSLTVSGNRGGAGGADFGAGSNMKTFAEAKQENLGMNSDKAEYFSATGMVSFIKKENALYQGCANMIDSRSCNKKVNLLNVLKTFGLIEISLEFFWTVTVLAEVWWPTIFFAKNTA